MFTELHATAAAVPLAVRACTMCKIEKPLTEFPRVQRWHRKVCHPCHLANRRAWRNQHADRVRAVQREYARSARGRETVLEAVRRYQARNPQKIAAQSALRYAIYRGDIVRPNQCEALGCEAPAHHAHHHNYAKPFDVIFLCRAHHEATHHVGPQRLKPAPGRRRKFARAPADGHRDGAQRADGGRGAGTTSPAVVGSAACQPVPPVPGFALHKNAKDGRRRDCTDCVAAKKKPLPTDRQGLVQEPAKRRMALAVVPCE